MSSVKHGRVNDRKWNRGWIEYTRHTWWICYWHLELLPNRGAKWPISWNFERI